MPDLLNPATTQSIIYRIVGALVILIVGWIIARIVAAAVRGGLRRSGLDQRIARFISGQPGGTIDVADLGGTLVYYLIILLTLLGVFQVLELTIITQPLNQLLTSVFAYIPLLIGAALLILLAWIVATILRAIVTHVLSAIHLDQRLGEATGATAEAAARPPLSENLGDVVYWFVFLLFLPAILSTLGLSGLLQPVVSMVDKILGFLPNVITAGVILLVGWVVGRIVQRIVTNLLAALGIDRLGARLGMTEAAGGSRLSEIVGVIVFVLIIIPVILSALNTVGLTAVTAPLSTMLTEILAAIPNIFAAAVVLVISYFVGRLLGELVASILAGVGFNSLPARLGLNYPPEPGRRTPAQIVGTLVLVAFMLGAAIEAAQLMSFQLVAELLTQLTAFAAEVVLALIIFAIGLYFANVAYDAVRASGTRDARLLATISRVTILIFAGAIALREIGVANEIISIAFLLLFGAVAVAAAIAFGLGGRDVARRELEEWRASMLGGAPAPAVTPERMPGAAPRPEPGADS